MFSISFAVCLIHALLLCAQVATLNCISNECDTGVKDPQVVTELSTVIEGTNCLLFCLTNAFLATLCWLTMLAKIRKFLTDFQ